MNRKDVHKDAYLQRNAHEMMLNVHRHFHIVSEICKIENLKKTKPGKNISTQPSGLWYMKTCFLILNTHSS